MGRDVLAALLPWLLAAGGIAAAGLWLRFAVAPVAAAFRLGSKAERLRQQRRWSERDGDR